MPPFFFGTSSSEVICALGTAVRCWRCHHLLLSAGQRSSRSCSQERWVRPAGRALSNRLTRDGGLGAHGSAHPGPGRAAKRPGRAGEHPGPLWGRGLWRCGAGAAGPLAQGRYLCGECAARGCRGPVPWARGAGVRVSPGAGISAMRGWLLVLPQPSCKQRVFAPLFLAPCLCSAPSVLPALLRSASCFSFPSEQRCYSSPERVIFIGAERICARLRAVPVPGARRCGAERSGGAAGSMDGNAAVPARWPPGHTRWVPSDPARSGQPCGRSPEPQHSPAQ